MKNRKLVAGIAVVLLVLLAVAASASAWAAETGGVYLVAESAALRSKEASVESSNRARPVTSFTHTPSTSAQPNSGGVNGWSQVNSNGFGVAAADEVSAIAAFNGYLYAGTSNATDGARIFRSADGLTWSPVIDSGFGSDHDTAPPAILDLAVFNGYLYASTGRGNAAQIWRTADGTNWARVVNAGFGDPDIVEITVLAEYGGRIYAGVTHSVTGAQIWRSYTGDSNSWTKVAPAVAGADRARVTGLVVFDGALNAVVESEAATPVEIWRSYGGTWTVAVDDGFGDVDTTRGGGAAVFGNDLYVGAGNETEGAQLWRSDDGLSWVQVIPPAFGDPSNQKATMVYVFENDLYVGVENPVTGMEIWRSHDGAVWEQVNQDGFGDSNNSGSAWSNATATFLGQLYQGTANVGDGGELWRMAASAFHAVVLSPDDSRTGFTGETVTYTVSITNSGNVSDTFGLTLAGHGWPVSLSAATVTLLPGASGTFEVAVAVPAGAMDNEADSVTVTATSVADSGVMDSAILTTRAIAPSNFVYLPALLGPP